MAADLSAAVRGVAATRVTGLLTEHDPRRARALTGHFAVVDHGHLASTVPTEQPAHAQHNDNSGAVDV
jgi:ABC-type branched-subunit amino acid transport system ATPase component